MDGSGSGIGWDLCAGLLYEHRFAMLIRGRGIEIKDKKVKIRQLPHTTPWNLSLET